MVIAASALSNEYAHGLPTEQHGAGSLMNLDPKLVENMKRQRCPVVPRGSPKTETAAAGLVKRPLKFRVAPHHGPSERRWP